jgi:protein O-mannosyl-transferase
LMGGVLAAMVVGTYANSFRGVFVFDDLPAIVENSTIKRGTHVWEWLQPPALSTVAGRPVVNFTFALNQVISADAVWSYHAVNLLIHLAAGAFLFGIVRRTLARRGVESSIPTWAITALWLLHPLQTESVTYLVQRAESLMGLVYLAAVYSFVRAVDDERSRRWPALTVLLALIGMATKESMVTLPVLLLLYDRTFAAGSFTSAWQRRRWFYSALACTWGLLAYLVLGTHSRGGSAGFGTSVGAWDYFVTQLYAVVHYLRLTFFPRPLIFDYGEALMKWSPLLAIHAAIYFALLGATLVALIFRPVIGFCGAAFFLLLAPTSTFVPVASQAIAEHRMYLALVLPIVAVVVTIHSRLDRKAWPLWLAAAAALALVTAARNADYHSAFALWSDTAAKRPGNARAHDWLGLVALRAGRGEAALEAFQRAVALQPRNAKFRNNAGAALATLGRPHLAIGEFEKALALDPASGEAQRNLGEALMQRALTLIREGRGEESIPHLRRMVELAPDDPVAAYNLNLALQQLGRAPRP